MTKMLVSAVFIGLVVWALTDSIQTYSLTHIFSNKLEQRFSLQAERQRIMFDRYVKSHHQAVKLFVASRTLSQYLSSKNWLSNREVVNYTTPPPWLPQLSVMRSIIQPRFLILLNTQNKTQEIYNASLSPTPQELKSPSLTLLNLSHGQGYLTRLNNKPYLLASESVLDQHGNVSATLMLASPLDEEFLIASQASMLADSSIIALLAENQPTIMVSSNSSLIPKGTKIETLKNKYFNIGQGFFDYGATDMLIELVSFISTDEASQLTHDVLNEVRPVRGITAAIYILAFILYMFFITRRLQLFTHYVVNFSEKMNLKKIISSNNSDEINILEDNFNRLSEAIANETEALTHQALHDHLTSLPNRKLLHNRIEQEILRGNRSSNQFVLLLGDLNHFKEINDTLGHHIGDVILQQVAQRLCSIFRKSDTVSRLGGDEFAILLPETSLEQAEILLHKVIENFNRSFIIESHSLHISISIGMTEYPTHGDDVNVLIQRADIAMYVAKQNKLGYSIYDPNEDTHSIGHLALMSELRTAIHQQELEIYFQPTINVNSEEIIGAEALLRWQHPERGFISPSEFIPLAEKTGLIKPLTYWMLEKSIQQHILWKEKNIHLKLSVNLSVHNLYDKRLLAYLKLLLEENNMSHQDLILEISESDIMTKPQTARKILSEIKQTGTMLSIDDFGTGYSSLSYIKKLPVDEIKIDRSFVMDMIEDSDDDIIVQATIQLAHNLGLKIVAEGVADKRTWERIKELKCDVAQGYYISPPLKADEFVTWVLNKNWESKSDAG